MGLGSLLDGLDAFRDDAASGAGKTGKLARAVCDGYAGNPNLGKAVQIGFNGYDAPLEYGCGPYWNGPDGYAPPSGEREALPFEGGQCPDVLYNVGVAKSTNPDSFLWELNESPIFGPVSGGSVSPQTLGNAQRTLVVTGRDGTFTRTRSTSLNSTPEPESLLILVRRADGQPDLCGNPEPTQVPRNPGSPPPGTGFGLPRDIGEPGDPFIVTPQPPEIGPKGPYFPIETPFGDIPFFPGDPDVEPLPSPPGEGPPVDVDGAGEVDADPDDEEEAEDNTLLGYRFTVRERPSGFQSVIPGTSPSIYSRVVGSIQLKLRSESGTFYSDNLQITSEEGSIVKNHPTLNVVGCVYNVLPDLAGLTLREIRGKDDDS
jgi:hypothetical protein